MQDLCSTFPIQFKPVQHVCHPGYRNLGRVMFFLFFFCSGSGSLAVFLFKRDLKLSYCWEKNSADGIRKEMVSLRCMKNQQYKFSFLSMRYRVTRSCEWLKSGCENEGASCTVLGGARSSFCVRVVFLPWPAPSVVQVVSQPARRLPLYPYI